MKNTIIIIASMLVMSLFSGCYVCEPGERGLKVTMGSLDRTVLKEGWGGRMPFFTSVYYTSIKQQKNTIVVSCFSSDLQQVSIKLDVLYAVPEQNVISLFELYSGNHFSSLIEPRLNEAMKEVTSAHTAEAIVKQREIIKKATLDLTIKKVGGLLDIRDIAINNIDLSNELEKAIEAKMVQEQEAAKARFIKQKAQIEAETAIVRAKGEAEAIRIRGDALKNNPSLIDLQIVEKWNGVSPQVVGGGSGANVLLPINSK